QVTTMCDAVYGNIPVYPYTPVTLPFSNFSLSESLLKKSLIGLNGGLVLLSPPLYALLTESVEYTLSGMRIGFTDVSTPYCALCPLMGITQQRSESRIRCMLYSRDCSTGLEFQSPKELLRLDMG